MRIVGGAEDLVVALQVAGVDGQIGFAEDDRARFAQQRDRPCIFGGDEVLQLRRARGSTHAGGLERILDGHWDAVERAANLAAREGSIGGVSLLAGALAIDGDDAVDGLVERLDAGEEIIECLAARDFALSDLLRDCDRAGVGKLCHGGSPPAYKKDTHLPTRYGKEVKLARAVSPLAGPGAREGCLDYPRRRPYCLGIASKDAVEFGR